MAYQFVGQTTPSANYTSTWNSNSTDPCRAHGNDNTAPTHVHSSTAYVAIGPISNFTTAVHACCPNHTANATQNYDGGPAPLSCYYYCAFNGTFEDAKAALQCTQQKAEDGGEHDVLVWGASLDWPGQSLGVRMGAKIGLWKWAVLGLVVVAAARL
ncbi:hypothetical protein OPT61_g5226 [Boeremia exigua]|uniref:Uncharacterized protein n=1 Tax=Boeremia exigua TaxID=749465 RepID=A0ACC2IB71_9PLEO|nr:hypothetical protein OPT61_g5226 [Boeremia exigua]